GELPRPARWHRGVHLALSAGAPLAHPAHGRHEHHAVSQVHRVDDSGLRRMGARLCEHGLGRRGLLPAPGGTTALRRLCLRRGRGRLPRSRGAGQEGDRTARGAAHAAPGRRRRQHDRRAVRRGLIRALQTTMGADAAHPPPSLRSDYLTMPTLASHSLAMTAADFLSLTLSELRLTRSSCDSLASTLFRIDSALESTFFDTIGAMLSGKKRPSGSASATRWFDLMFGSAV